MKHTIPVAEPDIGQEELKNVIEAVKSGWLSSKGPFIEKFEREFSSYIGPKHAIATSSGTTALHLALTALGIRSSQEVIVPTLTFIATANAVAYTGAKTTFVDSHPDYWCIDPEKIKYEITAETKAIIPVHIYGHPCDMDPIIDLAEDHGLFIIEDAAEAHGATYKGKKVGSLSDISCFSFYGNKIITTGEGGMCLTDNEELAEKIRILRDHGMNPRRRYWHDTIGFNYRMTNLQAGIGVAQVRKIDEVVEKKTQIAKWYSETLTELREEGSIRLHPEMPWAKCVYWMYSILVEDKARIKRDELMKKLEEESIETRPFFFPVHEMPMYKTERETFPVSERLSERGINLPSSVKLRSEDVLEIAEVIKRVLRT